jgi:hypothetical protein
MDQATQFVSQNSSIINTLLFLALVLGILYAVYTYLYPADDPNYTVFLSGDADARRPVQLKGKMPEIHTGGDFTLSFWVYIDDFNYKSNSYKHVFSICKTTPSPNGIMPLVGVLTPLTNGLMVRAATVKSNSVPAPGSMPTATASAAGPDITVSSSLDALLNQQTSMTMFNNGLNEPCDIKEVPLQRWVCVTIVSSGRVLDVYMDGKLTRSCVLDGVVNVPRGDLRLVVGAAGGFGGRISSIQMWSTQLTPDVIYGIYQMGPTQARHDLFTDIAKWFNINASFTAPGVDTKVPADFLGGLSTSLTNAGHAAQGSLHEVLGDANLQSLCARL